MMNPRHCAMIGALLLFAFATNTFAASAGTAAFTVSSYSVQQSAGRITFSVSRTGGTSGGIQVGYTTVHGTATPGTNYTSTQGTLTWANGDASTKTITVPIAASPPIAGSKQFTMQLTGPTG